MQMIHDMLTAILAADGNLLLWIQDNLRTDWLTPFMIRFTHLGDHGIIWIVIGVILLFPRKTRRAAITALIALICAHLLCNMVLKDYVARIRPYDVIAGLNCIIGRENSWSFPSGHAMTAFAFAVAIYKSRPKRLGIPIMIIAVAISVSRLYVGVHYPSDVIFGAVLGALIGLLVFWLIGDKKYKEQARRARAKRRKRAKASR